MFEKEIYIARRAMLMARMKSTGIVVIPGNELSPNSYLNNPYYFRQDGSFRYLFGLDRASLWGVIDLDSYEVALYGNDSTLDDIIWTGEQPSIRELAAEVGVEITHPISELKPKITKVVNSGRKIHILPPYRGETKIALADLLNIKVSELPHNLSPELIFAVAELRECKGDEEIQELEQSYKIGYAMHTTAMRMVQDGIVEREVGGALEGIARSMGAGVSFPPICTQHGEILHNIAREGVLRDGRLFLCDAGGETLSGYCSDHTRTYPINGKFTSVQRDIYNVTLAAHNHVSQIARPAMLYSELQRETYRILGEGLRDLRFLRGSTDEILESGVVSLFMPHGVGHGLGLDVHDCEALGERTFDVEKFAEQASHSTSCIIRAKWILNKGTVLTNEPGLYFIPELIERRRSEALYRDVIDWDMVSKHLDFGGIRIEDDIIITESGCREVGATADKKIPISVEEIEEFMKR
ncbi:MAG: aminopeptidase P family protein [Rikenellaceae bacterium]